MKSYLILLFILLIPQAFFWPQWDWIGEAMVSVIVSAALVGIINSLYLEYKITKHHSPHINKPIS